MTNETSTKTIQFLKELAKLLGEYGAEICSENSPDKTSLYINNKQVFRDYEISQTIIEKKITEKKNWLVFFSNYEFDFRLEHIVKTTIVENATMLEAENIADTEIAANRKLVEYRIREATPELCLAAVKPTNTQS